MRMRGKMKRRGRCSVPGHGQRCVVTKEIRQSCIGRAAEKREWRKEARA